MDVQKLRARLEDFKEELEGNIANLDNSGLRYSMTDSVQELTSYDNEPGDLATEMFERGKDIGLRANDALLLKRVEMALERIDDGTFGVCSVCGRAISDQRLGAQPWAVRCLRCQEADDREHPVSRQYEEEILSPPYGRTFLDGTGNVGFDGEDSWQRVALMGNATGPQDVPPAVSYEDAYIDSSELWDATEPVEKQVDANGEPIELPPKGRDRRKWPSL